MEIFNLLVNKKNSIIWVVFFVILISLFIIHGFGVVLKLYGIYWWLDIVAHLFGGVLLGLFFKLLNISNKFIYLYSLIVIIIWELFEVFIVRIQIFSYTSYFMDTTNDMINGLLGMLIGIYFYRKLEK